ncbi:MAG: hypothetical protein JWP35_4687 [Caulobacter sp.]|nr:hypothetical protein [Caulobacter sp.]
MNKTPLTAALATVLAVSMGGVTLAQTTYSDPQADQRYQDQQQQYQDSQQDYANRQADYADKQDDYQRRQAAYQQQRADYERARADYDARYGYGAYVRRYGSFENRYPAEAATDYPSDVAYNDYYGPYRGSPCEQQRSDRTVGGGLIGALAGAAIGSNLAGHGVRTEGAVLGAVAGGVIGANVGRSTARCDTSGYYYGYEQTYPYRESGYDRRARSGRYGYSYYSSRRCRLAIAPAQYGDDMDYRYVRVCPDGRGRYRFTE